MENSMMDVNKADEFEAESMVCLSEWWAEELHNSTARVKYLRRETIAIHRNDEGKKNRTLYFSWLAFEFTYQNSTSSHKRQVRRF